MVSATDLWKRYDGHPAVRGVSVQVAPGEVLGLVGPNGSGKTTTIRMLLGILAPDSGAVSLFGSGNAEEAWARTGYLPEERGLYRGLRVTPTLVYLAELKGMSRHEAERQASDVLDRLGMSEHARKKIRELSRGMGQLIQFGATIIHNPRLIILDEPFAGLDPINVRLMKQIIGELRDAGACVMFSTHQMTDVEELCDRVMMIHQGEVVLEGPLDDVRRRYASSGVTVASSVSPGGLPGVASAERDGSAYSVRLSPGTTPERFLRTLLEHDARIERFEIAMPSLEEVFLRVVDERA